MTNDDTCGGQNRDMRGHDPTQDPGRVESRVSRPQGRKSKIENGDMIPVRLLNGSEIYINAELVETVAAVPDTVITLSTGRKLIVATSPEAVLAAVLEYRRRVHQPPRTGIADSAEQPAAKGLPIANCRLPIEDTANGDSEIGNRKSEIGNREVAPGLCPLEGQKRRTAKLRGDDIVRSAK